MTEKQRGGEIWYLASKGNCMTGKTIKDPYDIVLFSVIGITGLIVIAFIIAMVLNFAGLKIPTDFLNLIPVIFSIMVVLVVPKSIVRRECEKYFNGKEYKEFLVNNFATKQELFRVDAHLSRMIAVYLRDNYPLWSLGWAFRSLKRYSRLPESNNIYTDFLSFMEKLIGSNNNKIIEYINNKGIKKLVKNKAAISGFEDENRVVERAVKDIIDYIIHKIINNRKSYQENYCDHTLLLLTLILYEYNSKEKINNVCNDICGISDYVIAEKENEETFFKDTIKKYFETFENAMKEYNVVLKNHILAKELKESDNLGKKLIFKPVITEKIRQKYNNVELK